MGRKRYIGIVFTVGCEPPFQVAVGVVTRGVSGRNNLPVNVGMSFHIAADAKKGGFGMVLLQYVEHLCRDDGCWPVIKGKVK